jgi:hypothetical protein
MTDVSVKTPLGSRAVLRRVEAGSMALCVHCRQQVKFAAKLHRYQAIANVYTAGRWDRVEHFHEECYDEAGEPFGPASDQQVPSRRSSR